MPDSHRNAVVPCNYELKLPKFKDLCIKITEKALQDDWMYVDNTEVVKDFASRFEYSYSWHWKGVS